MGTSITVSIELVVNDEAALRREVREQLLEAGIDPLDADEALDANRMSLAEVARLCVDRDLRPSGVDIVDSYSQLEPA